MMDLAAINGLAVAAATAVAFMLGGLWYGPLFGKAWLSAVGKTEEDLQPSPGPFIVSLVSALVTCITLAVLIQLIGISSAVGGIALGLAMGVGFIATAMASDNAFCGWGLKLYFIQAGYRLTYSILMGAILGAWQ